MPGDVVAAPIPFLEKMEVEARSIKGAQDDRMLRAHHAFVEYVELVNKNINRQFVVSVAPNSMAPKDEISEQNQAVKLFTAKAIDPLNLFKKLNFPDPQESAKMLMMYLLDPAGYLTQLSGTQPQIPGQQGQVQTGQVPGQAIPNDTGLAEPSPAENVLSQVPLNQTKA